MSKKERKGKTSKKRRKDIEVQRVKRPTPTWAADALIGIEKQNGKWKRTKERNKNWSPTQLPRIIQSPPKTHRDHMVSLFFLTPWPTGRVKRIG